MAKEQNLSLNPSKISGLCGRLMCCLKYEQDYYECVRAIMPKAGREIMTPEGPAEVLETNFLTQMVKVKLITDDGADVKEFSAQELKSFNTPNVEEEHVDDENDEILDDELKSLLDD